MDFECFRRSHAIAEALRLVQYQQACSRSPATPPIPPAYWSRTQWCANPDLFERQFQETLTGVYDRRALNAFLVMIDRATRMCVGTLDAQLRRRAISDAQYADMFNEIQIYSANTRAYYLHRLQGRPPWGHAWVLNESGKYVLYDLVYTGGGTCSPAA